MRDGSEASRAATRRLARAAAPAWLVWTNLSIVYVIWGSTYLAIRVAVETLPPLLSASMRFVFAGLIILAMLALRRGPGALRVTRRELLAAGVVGALLLLGGNGLVMIAERDVPSGLTALIIGSVPLWVIVLRLLHGERLRRITLAGVALGFTGVAVLVLPEASGPVLLIGLLMLLVASASWAVGSFYSRRLPLPTDPFVSTGYQMLIGGLFLLFAGPLVGELNGLDPARFSTDSILAMAYLLVFGSLVAFTSYTWLLQNATVSRVATYAYVNPVVAVVLGTLVLREPVTPTLLVGALIVVAAVAFIVRTDAAPAAPALPLEQVAEAGRGRVPATGQPAP
jgi:drug/metabolite transporter (DMT)-like permease